MPNSFDFNQFHLNFNYIPYEEKKKHLKKYWGIDGHDKSSFCEYLSQTLYDLF